MSTDKHMNAIAGYKDHQGPRKNSLKEGLRSGTSLADLEMGSIWRCVGFGELEEMNKDIPHKNNLSEYLEARINMLSNISPQRERWLHWRDEKWS